jgi:hypothetical protein
MPTFLATLGQRVDIIDAIMLRPPRGRIRFAILFGLIFEFPNPRSDLTFLEASNQLLSFGRLRTPELAGPKNAGDRDSD